MTKIEKGSTFEYGPQIVEVRQDGTLRLSTRKADWPLLGYIDFVLSDGTVKLSPQWEEATQRYILWTETIDEFDIPYRAILRLKANVPPEYVNTREAMIDWLYRIAWGAVKVAGLGKNALSKMQKVLREDEDLIMDIRRSRADRKI